MTSVRPGAQASQRFEESPQIVCGAFNRHMASCLRLRTDEAAWRGEDGLDRHAFDRVDRPIVDRIAAAADEGHPGVGDGEPCGDEVRPHLSDGLEWGVDGKRHVDSS